MSGIREARRNLRPAYRRAPHRASFGAGAAFFVFAAVAVIGAVCTALIPRSPADAEVPVAAADEPALDQRVREAATN